VGHRNGHRPRTVDSRVGRLELEIPKLRQGSFLPSLFGAPAADRAGPVGGDPGGLGPRS
jgi:hypothetical protein